MITQQANPVKPSPGAVVEFEVVLVKDDRDPDYAVFCPSLPGCGSQGDTRTEALEMIADAIQGFLEFSPQPERPPYDKERLIAEYTADGCTVEVATVRVNI